MTTNRRTSSPGSPERVTFTWVIKEMGRGGGSIWMIIHLFIYFAVFNRSIVSVIHRCNTRRWDRAVMMIRSDTIQLFFSFSKTTLKLMINAVSWNLIILKRNKKMSIKGGHRRQRSGNVRSSWERKEGRENEEERRKEEEKRYSSRTSIGTRNGEDQTTYVNHLIRVSNNSIQFELRNIHLLHLNLLVRRHHQMRVSSMFPSNRKMSIDSRPSLCTLIHCKILCIPQYA